MYSYQEDIDLLQDLDKKRYSKCFYCTDKPLYVQPEKNTGNLVDVCKEHFIVESV